MKAAGGRACQSINQSISLYFRRVPIEQAVKKGKKEKKSKT